MGSRRRPGRHHFLPSGEAMKAHLFRELVNDLRDIATQWHGSQQLRERISRRLRQDVSINEDPANDSPGGPSRRRPRTGLFCCAGRQGTQQPRWFSRPESCTATTMPADGLTMRTTTLWTGDLSRRTGCRYQHLLKVSLPLWQHTGSKLR